MKKQYIVPQAEIVNVRLRNSVLDNGAFARPSVGAYGGDETGFGDAKENNLEFEEDDTFTTPTQPNLWDDEEQ